MIGVLLSAAFMELAPASHLATSYEPLPWGEFRRTFRGRVVDGFNIAAVSGGQGQQVRYVATRTNGAASASTDSASCPELVALVESLPQLTLPPLQPPRPDVVIASEGAYSMTVHSNGYSITIRSGGGPLGDWVQGALTTLEQCWSVE